MEVGEHVVTFNMNEAIKFPHDNSTFIALNAIDYAIEKTRDEHELSLHDNDRDNTFTKGLLSDLVGSQNVLEAGRVTIEQGLSFCYSRSRPNDLHVMTKHQPKIHYEVES